MLKNKKNKEKLVEADVGFAEDAFELLKHSVADEGHCIGNYIDTANEKYLKDLEEARRFRTRIANMVTNVISGGKMVSQNWCRLKHLCGKAMTCQEIITRFLSMGDYESAKKLSEEYKNLYFEYLELLGINEKNYELNNSKA